MNTVFLLPTAMTVSILFIFHVVFPFFIHDYCILQYFFLLYSLLRVKQEYTFHIKTYLTVNLNLDCHTYNKRTYFHAILNIV